MAFESYPHATETVDESEWRVFAREFARSGVLGTGHLVVTANDTDLNITVAAGKLLLEGFTAVVTGSEILTVAAGDATNPRIDTIVARYDPDGAGSGQGSIVLAVKAGAPAGAPVAPALTQTDAGIYEFPLANVRVEAGAALALSANVTDRRVRGGLNPVLNADGTVPLTANLDAGGQKITNAGAGTAGTDLVTKAQLDAAGAPTTKIKTADESVASSAVLQDDDHLFAPLAANKTYAFEANLAVVSATTPDYKLAFTVPAGATLRWHAFSAHDTASLPGNPLEYGVVTASGTPLTITVRTTETRIVRVVGSVVTAGTAGNLQLQWAQDSANATPATVKAGSFLRVSSS